MTTSSPSPGQTADALDAWFTPGRFAVVLAAVLFALHPDIVFGYRSFFFRDFGFFGYPLAHYHRADFWRGNIPLWNPLSDCGLPFLAQWNTMVLYPGSLFYLLFPLPWSLSMFCLFHQFLAGCGMYCLALRWTSNRLAASVAGMGFAFSGLTLSCLMWPNNIAALGWMPWVVLAADRAQYADRLRVAQGAGVAGMQMLSGAPEITLQTWLIVSLLLPGQIWRGLRSGVWPLLRLPAVVLLVSGLSLIQLLPFLDLLSQSQRDVSFAKSGWSMPGTGWANLVVPAFNTYLSDRGVRFQYDQFWASSYYPGVGILSLALFGAASVRRARVLATVAATMLGLILALGDNGYLFKLLSQVAPQTGVMRYPIKFVVLAVFGFPVLAAFGVAQFQNHLPAIRRRALGGVLFACGIVLAAIVATVLYSAWKKRLVPVEWMATWSSGLTRGLLLAGTAAALGLCCRVASSWFARLGCLGLLALILLDNCTHAPNQNPTVESLVFKADLSKSRGFETHAVLGQSRVMISPQADKKFRYYGTLNPRNDYLAYRLGLFSNCNLLEGLPKINGFYSLYLRHYDSICRLIYESNVQPSESLFDFLGVSYINRPGEALEWQRRPGYQPMMTVGQQAIFLDEAEAFFAVTQTRYAPGEVVYLPLEAKGRISATNRVQARVLDPQIKEHLLDSVVDAGEPVLLVLAQSYYHRWKAYIDGEPARVWRANYAFQAVEVPRGRHSVRFVYHDAPFHLGAALSWLSLLLCLLLRFSARRSDAVAGRARPSKS